MWARCMARQATASRPVPPQRRSAYRKAVRPFALFALLALAVAGCGDAPTPTAPAADDSPALPAVRAPLPDLVRVRLDTDAGPILLALDAEHAPVTAAN